MSEMFDKFDSLDALHIDVDVHNISDKCVDIDFHAMLRVENDSFQVELDTGAKCNILSLQSLRKLNFKYALGESATIITGIHGVSSQAIGSVTLPCSYKNMTRQVEFQVLDGKKAINLLGRADCVRFGLVARTNKVTVNGACESIVSRYADVFGDQIGCLPGEYDIKIDESIPPVIHPPRSVPCALRERVKEELQRLERLEIIKKVSEPTPWVNSMVVVSKKDKNQVRICIDPTDLNKAIMREHFPMSNIDDIVTRIHGSKYFSTLDANMGYFQIKLSEESSYLTTFNTPFGRYRNRRMPMGAKCSSDKFQSALVGAFEGIPGVEVYQDDVLIHGRTMVEHNDRLEKVLQKCRNINLKLNKGKCVIGKSEVNYIGHKLTAEGLQPTDERVKAIANMRPPKDVKELETILGMVAYVAKFIPRLSTLTAPLRELKQQDEWNWGPAHQVAFDDIKRELSSNRVLKYFDVSKPLLISVDASCKGLGAAAIQDGAVIAYASRALTPTEQRYAQIEKEMLAVVYGCTKFHKLAYGKDNLTVESDHKPLESLMKKPLAAAPMRIQRMRLKLEPYSFNLVHVSGKSIGLADCLSRLPIPGETNDVMMDEDLMVCKVDTLAYKWHQQIEDATRENDEMLALKAVIFNGWPANKQDLPLKLTPYWNVRDELSTYNGIIFKGERIVIPPQMRDRILRILHQAHLGMVKTKQRARDMVYWPGLNGQIEEMASKCPACLEHRAKQQKEPMTIHPIPALPWNKVGTDLFEHDGKNYILLVDYYSNYIEVAPLNQDTRSVTVIRNIKTMIARYGIMETLMSDNGPQYISEEFKGFTEAYNINHITSSPTFPQSNGLAEEAVRQVKDLMTKCKLSGDDFFLALLDLRNTPRDETMGSPMQRLHGRRAQTSLPIADSKLKPTAPEANQVHDKMMGYRRRQKLYYDRGAQQLTPIEEEKGLRVRTPRGWKPAEYIRPDKTPNSHIIKAGEQGRLYRRNRRDLLVTGERPHIVRTPEPVFAPETQMRPQPPSHVRTPEPVFTPETQTRPGPPSPTKPPLPTKPPSPASTTALTSSRPTRQRKAPAWLKDYAT